MSKKVAIIMGSDSDLPKMQGAIDLLKEFQVPHYVEVVSAHRTPNEMLQFAAEAEKNDFSVIIAGAGGAAHLPGMVASNTRLPVIGIPINITALNGMDALLSIVQMPKGVPVAAMAVDNSTNGALLAVRILALSDPSLKTKLDEFQNFQKEKVARANAKLNTSK
ncbi:MAG: 5-(carboxyamino)imidazole ribonucleotide mutase [Bdellovibrionaceae bacterium]|nr:5-(carboxyamino)imidazole ribonucleotide mutase [Pseudobdellovibrionaceae bacterium]|tara:strand:+ start:16853 stop:17344 length:492 start_codon:yes stop_codon:yes gene_type:complete